MSKQVINLGTAPTGQGGDTPRSANAKAIANFDELYDALGATGSPQTLPPAIPVGKGGTGGNTPAAARAGLGLKNGSIFDVVGNVGSGGGTAIIERGQNSNGAYTLYADGTLIQWGSMSTAAIASGDYSGKTITFPVQFFDNSYGFSAVAQPTASNDHYGIIGYSSRLAGSIGAVIRNNAAAQAFNVVWTAIGRKF